MSRIQLHKSDTNAGRQAGRMIKHVCLVVCIQFVQASITARSNSTRHYSGKDLPVPDPLWYSLESGPVALTFSFHVHAGHEQRYHERYELR
jgi:hypothetical protein